MRRSAEFPVRPRLRRRTEISSRFRDKDSVQKCARRSRGVLRTSCSAHRCLGQETAARSVRVQLHPHPNEAHIGTGHAGEAPRPSLISNPRRPDRRADKRLTREAALRNILGLPPSNKLHIVPVSPPAKTPLPIQWKSSCSLPSKMRPHRRAEDSSSKPRSNGSFRPRTRCGPRSTPSPQYRWNGLRPAPCRTRDRLSTGVGTYTDWTLASTFSVPAGCARAGSVRQERSDRIVTGPISIRGCMRLCTSWRARCATWRGAYKQYLAYHESRLAADINKESRRELQRGRPGYIYLNVLQADERLGFRVVVGGGRVAGLQRGPGEPGRRTGHDPRNHGLYFTRTFGRRAAALAQARPRLSRATAATGRNMRIWQGRSVENPSSCRIRSAEMESACVS